MDVKQIFGGHYKRLVAEGIVKSAVWALVVCLSVNSIFAALYWMLGVGAVWLGAAVGIPLGAILGVLLYIFKYKPTEKAVAARIDRYGLEERMITMLELRGDTSTLAELQREDARGSLGRLPAESIGIRPARLPIAVASVLLALAITLCILGIAAAQGKIPYGRDLLVQGADGSFEVVYTVEGGGFIKGAARQSVGFGEDATTVRAVADNGWRFVGWDDGEDCPERCESAVGANMEIKARFEKISSDPADGEDGDAADDLPYGEVIEEGGGGSSDQLGGDNVKDDGEGSGGGKWQDRNQFIDGATYYRDYLEFYYQYATGIFEAETDIPEEIIEFFETYFSGI